MINMSSKITNFLVNSFFVDISVALRSLYAVHAQFDQMTLMNWIFLMSQLKSFTKQSITCLLMFWSRLLWLVNQFNAILMRQVH